MTDISNRKVIGDGATWATHKQVGAPQMSSTVGSNGQLLQVLDAVLVDGFNTQTSTGVELLTDGFLKIKFGTFVDYRKRQKLLISGANDANLNGEYIITQVVGNDVVIKAPDVTVFTGAIKAKVAPLGWESVFGNANPLKRAYRSKNPLSNKRILYLDMTLPSGHGYDASKPAHRAMVSICDDMAEVGVKVNSYTDIINNYEANINGSLFWYQARGEMKTAAITTASIIEWTIVGNDSYFYLMPTWFQNTYTGQGDFSKKGLRDLYMFGDFPSLAGATDRWSCVWAGAYLPNDNNSAANVGVANGSYIGSSSNKYFISDYTGFSGMQSFGLFSGGSGNYHSGVVTGINYPNQTTNSMICERLYTLSSGSVRSLAPRILSIKHNLGNNYLDYDNSFSGDFLVVSTSAILKSANVAEFKNGYLAFDMGD